MAETAAAGEAGAIYLSPHLDDAALSCGGQIVARSRRGERPWIVTACTAAAPAELSPFARRLHRQWGLDGADVADVRRREDRAACAVLGAEPHHLDLLDGAYRRVDGDWLYPTWRALCGPPSPRDPALARLVELLARLPPAARVVAPLAAGGHVDHRLMRRAAEEVFGRRLTYYEDLPYARSRIVLLRALGWRRWRWRRQTIPLSAADLDAKCRAIACYASQFPDPHPIEHQIRTLAHHRGGERTWQRR